MILTRYAMLRFKFRKELFDVAAFPPLGLLQALANSFENVCVGGDVEQALVGLRVLHNCRRFTLNRQDDGALALLELFHKVAGAAAEGGQRMDVVGDVEHRETSLTCSTFLGAIKNFFHLFSLPRAHPDS